MYYLSTDQTRHRGMRLALAAALAIHAGLILSLGFAPSEPPDYAPQIKVTLATRPSQAAPDDARRIAQANQLGQAEGPDVSAVPPPGAPPPAASRPSAPDSLATPLTTRGRSSREVANEGDELPQDDAPPEPERDPLSQELADLEARLDEQSEAYSNLPRVRRLTTLSARESSDAAYLRAWRERVETVGNKYYPEASVRYGIYGDLRLLVVIRHDGTIEDIRVLSSSGYAVLDEAATKIVRMAAPFQAFPAEMRATTDKVEIIRTWQFQENRLSSD